jgi:hypothetical protein
MKQVVMNTSTGKQFRIYKQPYGGSYSYRTVLEINDQGYISNYLAPEINELFEFLTMCKAVNG